MALGHVALFVPDLRAAEGFYRHMFDMELLMRETELADHKWYTLPPDKGWGEAIAVGIELGMVALRRDDFVLALFHGNPAPRDTVLEIGIMMYPDEILAVRDRMPESATLVVDEYGDIMIDDPYGYRWHARTAGDAFRSNGESSGRWLEL